VLEHVPPPCARSAGSYMSDTGLDREDRNPATGRERAVTAGTSSRLPAADHRTATPALF
jgi:hypothetical protein